MTQNQSRIFVFPVQFLIIKKPNLIYLFIISDRIKDMLSEDLSVNFLDTQITFIDNLDYPYD